MRFLAGFGAGAALMWFRQTEHGRQWLGELLHGQAPRLRDVQHTAVENVSNGVQRVSEAIDAAPIPEPVKSAASEAAFAAWSATQSLAEQAGDAPAGSPGQP